MLQGAVATRPGQVMAEPDDAALLLESRRAPAAFRLLHDRHQAAVFGFLVRLVGDRALAEEVLQETWLRVHRSAGDFRPGAAFRPWLYAIARNAALNALRADRKVPTAPAAEPLVHDGPPEAAALAEQVARLRAALLAIPADARALLLEHHHLGLRPAELAQGHACTERTIRNRLHAAATLVAAALRREPPRAERDPPPEEAP